jgi:iron complex outermembrane receptor protein
MTIWSGTLQGGNGDVAGRTIFAGVAVCLSILLALLFVSNTPVLAGTATGWITGVLKDPSGAVVAGGQIGIRNLDSGVAKSTTTDQQGRYVFDPVPVGRYQVSATSSGFEPAVSNDITVASGRETITGFELRLGKNTTVVRVTEPAVTAGSETIVPSRARISDAVSLLNGTPGVDVYNSGGVSSLPVLHGMADDRVNVLIDGMSLASACANHMNPPTSYIDPANVGSVSVMAGITPVSRGGDSIGGTIAIESAAPEFAGSDKGASTHGGVSAFHRSNGVVNGGSAWVSAATDNFRVGYVGSYVDANDYKDGAGVTIKSTFYESRNHALHLAARRGEHVVTVDLGYQHIPQQGFVNARMDMTDNEAKLANVHYEGFFARVRLGARVYYENTRHVMNILRDKVPGMNMPMDTKGTNSGYSVEAEIPLSGRDTLRAGTELRRFALDDWWPPVTATVGSMGPDTLWNVRNGRRDRFGTFVEWEARRGKGWTEAVGVRSDVVRMNTDNVAGYNMVTATTGSAAYFADARDFNARDHHRLDNNVDLTAVARYEPGSNSTYEFGYARKTRSPSIYERYLWVKRSSMSANMNGWFGDGNGYVGNLDLRPEVANTLSVTAGWHAASKQGWEVKVTPYYTRVQDYIDVDRCPVIADGSNGCTAAKFAATSGFVTLQFANHAARLYGADGSFRRPLAGGAKSGSFALTGVLGYVRGQNLDTGGNLYHMMPLHGNLALEHHRGQWSSRLDFQAVDAKTDVQTVRNELRTPGYALFNLRSGYQWKLVERASMRLDAGIDNLDNRKYDLPLGGRYWVGDKAGNSSVAGMGRSIYGGLTFQF